MGLKEVKEEAESSTSSSSSSSSSGGGGGRKYQDGLTIPSGTEPGDFPIVAKACPKHLVRHVSGTEGREWEYITYPDTPTVYMEATWYGTWEFEDARPGNWERWWWSDDEFQYHCHIVDEVHGVSLVEQLNEDAERGIELLRSAANQYQSESRKREAQYERTCAVCGEELHVIYDDCTDVGEKVACDSHTVADLKHADLI